jgi:hypothetical protein
LVRFGLIFITVFQTLQVTQHSCFLQSTSSVNDWNSIGLLVVYDKNIIYLKILICVDVIEKQSCQQLLSDRALFALSNIKEILNQMMENFQVQVA